MYPQNRFGFRAEPKTLFLLAALCASFVLGACKKRLDDPDDRGRLLRVAARLEEAYANAPLPPLTEPTQLAERLSKWDDFRACTIKTYVARKRQADARARQGIERPSRHGSIGEETVEECMVQDAVVNKDASLCDRLAIDYTGPSGEVPLAAVRCWDTRARVLGLPDECPVVWMPGDVAARNPECVALARRDASLCPFSESPGRCRALLTGDSAACTSIDAAPDCPLALDYWNGLIPAGSGPPLVAPPKDKPWSATFDIEWTRNEQPHMRIEGPQRSCGISWPAGRARSGPPENTTAFWGANLPPEAAQITWKEGAPAIKLAFVPGGALSGTRPLQMAGPAAAATVMVVWPDPRAFRRCAPAAHSTGEVRFDAGTGQPGSAVTGTADLKKLACSDGTEIDLQAKFRLVILDVR